MTCFWTDLTIATQICPEEGGSEFGIEPLMAVSAFSGSGGVNVEGGGDYALPYDPSTATLEITGYFTPISAEEFESPTLTDPIDLSSYTYVELETPHNLPYAEFGPGDWHTFDVIPGAPIGYVYVTIDVNGSYYGIGELLNSFGF